MKPAILLVEDDESLGYVLREFLQSRGLDVTWVQDGAQGMKTFRLGRFDLCILDIMMPAIDGITLAELIRLHDPHVPILFLTARSMKQDVIRGFRAGADDYIRKPVNEEVLLARIEAVLRRAAPASPPSDPPEYAIGRYRLDCREQCLRFGEQTLPLTRREFELLRLFCRRRGQLLPRREVLEKLWGRTDRQARKSMDVFLSRLRKKLAQDPSVRLENVHGQGFVLRVEEQD
ncbi:MAG: DNA-binding response regulator [Bacteroidetes bacterium]|nr:MAG: DNA-binding response regulator [Bacteroidota bacterium]